MTNQEEVSPFLEDLEGGTSKVAGRRNAWKLGLAAIIVLAATLALFAATGARLKQHRTGRARPLFAPRLDALNLFENSGPSMSPYTVVIDCGSSGNRLYVYKVEDNLLVSVSNDCSDACRNDLPLASYLDKPEEAGDMINKLLAASYQYVPKHKQQTTPLYIFATAGMRLLPADKTQVLWEAVDKSLDGVTYYFQDSHAKTMSGDVEGAYQWLTVYSLNHNMTITETTSQVVHKIRGIMEMGGASLQVTFRPTGDIMLNEFDLYVDGEAASLYSTSYLGFGSNQAMDRSMEALLSAHPLSARQSDPCLFRGDEETRTMNGSKVTFVGTSDPKACAALVAEILHRDYECVQQPCGIMGTYSPKLRLEGRIIALSSFFYTAYNLGLIGWNEIKAVAPKDFKAGAESVCKLTKDELRRTPPYDEPYKNSKWDSMKSLCFMANFVAELLDAFGFPPDDTHVLYMRKYEDEDFTWTRGAVLYNTAYDTPTLGDQ